MWTPQSLARSPPRLRPHLWLPRGTGGRVARKHREGSGETTGIRSPRRHQNDPRSCGHEPTPRQEARDEHNAHGSCTTMIYRHPNGDFKKIICSAVASGIESTALPRLFFSLLLCSSSFVRALLKPTRTIASCCSYFEEHICFRSRRVANLTQLRSFLCEAARLHPLKPVRKYPDMTHLVEQKKALRVGGTAA